MLLTACGGGSGGNTSITPQPVTLDSTYMTQWQSDCQPIDEAPGNSGKVGQKITPSADGRHYRIRFAMFSYNGSTCSGNPVATASWFEQLATPQGTQQLATGETVQKIIRSGRSSSITVAGRSVTNLPDRWRVYFSNGKAIDVSKTAPATAAEKDIYLIAADGKTLYYGDASNANAYPTALDRDIPFRKATSAEAQALFAAAGIPQQLPDSTTARR